MDSYGLVLRGMALRTQEAYIESVARLACHFDPVRLRPHPREFHLYFDA